MTTGKKSKRFPLAQTTLTLARWSYGGPNVIGAAIVARTGDTTASVAGAFTPRKRRFDGIVERPTATLSPDGMAELLEALGDRVLEPPAPADDVPRFAPAPRSSRAHVMPTLGVLVLVGASGLVTAIGDGRASAIAIASAILLAAIAGAVWGWRRSAPLEIVVDDRLRRDMRAETGHVKVTGRYTGGVAYPAIALLVDGRRVVIQSSQGGAGARGRALHGPTYVLPPDELDRLCELLRLRLP